ncbi:MAG: hypothetical protein ACREQI_02730, partial [Candidatus Binataceae bacterium]
MNQFSHELLQAMGRERHPFQGDISPEWRIGARQSGDWRSQECVRFTFRPQAKEAVDKVGLSSDLRFEIDGRDQPPVGLGPGRTRQQQ